MISFRPRLSRRSFFQGIAASTAVVGLGGCTRVLTEVAALGTDVEVRKGFSYGPEDRQKLDLYLPEGSGPDTPLILFLYGGSWKWGSWSRYGFVGYSLASKGFAVAIADYRLYPQVRFPAFNHDAAQAAAWLQDNRRQWGLGQGRLHLVGHSAGAHMAALVALDPSYLAAAGLASVDIASVTGLAGPYGMYPSKIGYIADIFPAEGSEDAARPVTFARADAPPMLLLHGAADGLVAPRNSLEMAKVQQNKGSQARARIYEKIGHKEIVVALSTPFRGLAPVLDDVSQFIVTSQNTG